MNGRAAPLGPWKRSSLFQWLRLWAKCPYFEQLWWAREPGSLHTGLIIMYCRHSVGQETRLSRNGWFSCFRGYQCRWQQVRMPPEIFSAIFPLCLHKQIELTLKRGSEFQSPRLYRNLQIFSKLLQLLQLFLKNKALTGSAKLSVKKPCASSSDEKKIL